MPDPVLQVREIPLHVLFAVLVVPLLGILRVDVLASQAVAAPPAHAEVAGATSAIAIAASECLALNLSLIAQCLTHCAGVCRATPERYLLLCFAFRGHSGWQHANWQSNMTTRVNTGQGSRIIGNAHAIIYTAG